MAAGSPTILPRSGERLIGLVGADGGGGHGRRVDGGWYDMVGVPLAAWRSMDGVLHVEPLRCELVLVKDPDDDGDSDSYIDIAPYSIVELQVADDADETCRVPPDPLASRTPVAWLRSIIAVGVADPELERLRDELQVSIRIQHPRLGGFVYDRALDAYQGSIAWGERTLSLGLACADPAHPGDVLAIADCLLAHWPQWGQRASAFAAERLLALKNGEWHDEDDDGEPLPPVTAHEFLARLSPTALDIDASGDVTLWFEDSDLFFGHAIHVRGNASGEFDKAGIGG